jgi:hypothetical protein
MIVAHKPDEELTRANLLKVVEDADGWKVVCRWCNDELVVPIPFVSQRQINPLTGLTIIIKSKEKFMINFQELHYGKHMRQLHPELCGVKNYKGIRKQK